MTCPRSTGTTKVVAKPMLTTTPEVKLLANRQREAESTMHTRLSCQKEGEGGEVRRTQCVARGARRVTCGMHRRRALDAA